MPLLELTLAAGTDFNGTAGKGLIDFSTFLAEISDVDDSVRPLIMNIGVSAADTILAETIIRIAPPGSTPETAIGYVQLARSTDSQGVSLFACNIIVPRTFDFFVFSTEAVAGEKRLVVDWRGVRITPRTA